MTRLPCRLLAIVVLSALGIAQQPDMARFSTGLGGLEPDGESRAPAVSEDGRWVAFKSFATNLVPGDTNGKGDVFVHDRQTGSTELVSVASTGTLGNEESYAPSISADGRYIAFFSLASNLVAGDTNGRIDVFVRDRVTGATALISRSTSGVLGNADSDYGSISLDGRFVAFRSAASNLTPGDANGKMDIFVRELATSTTTLVSNSSSGAPSNGHSYEPCIAGNGRFVAFSSDATTLVSGDVNGVRDVFLVDLSNSGIRLVSADTAGLAGNLASDRPSLSADGRWLAFDSLASSLTAGDTNGLADVFVKDTITDTIVAITMGNGASINPSFSSDGSCVVYSSAASDLIGGDVNQREDVFWHDRRTLETRLVSRIEPDGVSNGSSMAPTVSRLGAVIAFATTADNLGEVDGNGVSDVYGSSTDIAPSWSQSVAYGSVAFGSSTALGDLDGDGVADLIVGDPLAPSQSGAPEGAVFIYRGLAQGGFESGPTWTLRCGQLGSNFGCSVSSGVDIDADCFDDLIVGASLYDSTSIDAGAAFAYGGGPSGPTTAPMAEFHGTETLGMLGYAVDFVRYATDVDYGCGNYYFSYGYLIGEPGRSGGAGAVHIHGDLPPVSWMLSSPMSGARLGEAVLGVRLEPTPDQYPSWTPIVAAVGAPGWSTPIGNTGAVLLLEPNPWAYQGLDFFPRRFLTGDTDGEAFGSDLGLMSDVTGEGLEEIVVSAPQKTVGTLLDAGAVYVYSDATRVSLLEGWRSGGELGRVLCSLGDFDGDGLQDVGVSDGGGSSPLSGSGSLLAIRGTSGGAVLSSAAIALSQAGGRLLSASEIRNPASKIVCARGRGGLAGTQAPELVSAVGAIASEACPVALIDGCFAQDPWSGGTVYRCDENGNTSWKYLVNLTCEPVFWTASSGCSVTGPQSGWLGPRSTISFGWGNLGYPPIAFTVYVDAPCPCGPGTCDLIIDAGGFQFNTGFLSENLADPDLHASFVDDTINCATGDFTAVIRVENRGCRVGDVEFTTSNGSLMLDQPQHTSIAPESSIDVNVSVDCNKPFCDPSPSLFLSSSWGSLSTTMPLNVSNAPPAAMTYCTPGTSSNGCRAELSYIGTPSASAGSGFILIATQVPGQRMGYLYYSVTGAQATPWGPSSTLCVAPPRQRMAANAPTGGTAGYCDGVVAQDWNAYIANHPFALGQPFAAGQHVWAQAYYRDPPSPKTTNLSDGLHFVLCP